MATRKDGGGQAAAPMIAALYVRTGGVYFGLPGVDPWDVKRDARRYIGDDPVVAHPPCDRHVAIGTGAIKHRTDDGADGGCFEHALATVFRVGGVLEHPSLSRAWRRFGIPSAPMVGWASWNGAWLCRVDQGHYGHRSRKATRLLFVGASPPDLRWGSSARTPGPDPFPDGTRRLALHPPKNMTAHQRALRRDWFAWYARETGKVYCCPESMNKLERSATPVEFRDLLLSMARSLRKP